MKPYVREMLLKWLAEQWEDWNRISEENRPLFTIYVELQALDLIKEVISDFGNMMAILRIKWDKYESIEKAVVDMTSLVRGDE